MQIFFNRISDHGRGALRTVALSHAQAGAAMACLPDPGSAPPVRQRGRGPAGGRSAEAGCDVGWQVGGQRAARDGRDVVLHQRHGCDAPGAPAWQRAPQRPAGASRRVCCRLAWRQCRSSYCSSPC